MSRRALVILFALLALAGCGRDEPIRIALIGGLAGNTTDTGVAARNALILAIEERNAAGGLHGRPLEIVVADDGQDADKARKAMASLLAAGPEVVVGPFTSSVADAILPQANAAGIVLFSPVVTATKFVGLDDMLIRLNRTTRDNARDYGQMLLARGQRRMTVAYDLINRSFSESWLAEFRRSFPGLGGEIVDTFAIDSSAQPALTEVARDMLAKSPDGLLLITSAVGAARLAQQVRKHAPDIPLTAVEWAASEELLQLGGHAVEGMLVAQSHDRDDPSPAFRRFREAFGARFGAEPGYSAVTTYDASIVLFEALDKRRKGQPLKAAILAHGPYRGLQGEIVLDRFGDSSRDILFAEIRDGRFALVQR